MVRSSGKSNAGILSLLDEGRSLGWSEGPRLDLKGQGVLPDWVLA